MLPPLLSVVEGAAAYTDDYAALDEDLQTRERAVADRERRGDFHPDVEGRLMDFLADRGPRSVW